MEKAMMSPSAFANQLGNRLRRLMDKLRPMMELQACSEDDRRQIAWDVGLSERDLLRLAGSNQGRNELMPQRLEQLHLDPAYVKLAHPAAYRDLERVCSCCTASERCARDLANGDVETGMRDYCLNAPTIDALIVERAGAPKKQ
jgi:hypothetical protein